MTGAVRTLFSAKGHALDLAVFRIAVLGGLLAALLRTDFDAYLALPEGLRVPPPGYGAWFDALPLDAGFVAGVRLVTLAATALALLGVRTRFSAAVACAGAAYLLLVPQLFGKVAHTHHHFVWFAALIAAAPRERALSIEAPLRGRSFLGADLAPSVGYALPLRFAWLLIGLIYLFPGIWKLLAGPEWFLGDNMRLVLWEHWLRKDFVARWRVDEVPVLYRSAAFAVVLFELAFLPLLFHRRTRVVAAAAGVVFHLSTRVFLRIDFGTLLLAYVAFVDWHALAARVWPRLRTPAAAPATEGARGVLVVGTVLLAANLVCGVLRIDSWPFSVFPRFDRVRTVAEYTAIEGRRPAADGTWERVRVPLPESTLVRIVRAPPGEERDRRLRGLRELVRRDAPGDVELVAVTRSTRPEDRDEPPLREEVLLRVQ